MAGKKRSASSANDITPRRSTRASTRSRSKNEAIPDVYREMLVDVSNEIKDTRPLKRKRPGEKSSVIAKKPIIEDDDDEDEHLEFEHVTVPQPTIQTVVRDTDDEDDDDDDDEIEFEDVNINKTPASSASATTTQQPKSLTLNLSALMAAKGPQKGNRRKPATREEKERRVEIHKAHLVCLLAHLELRNRWCNDPHVQNILEPLLSKKTIGFLRPKSSLNQFSKMESFKRGVQEAKEMFKTKFSITERGLRRALWAENEEQLKNYKLPEDVESTRNRSDFFKAARKLEGSRDVGAQLFCALLRSVRVEARLVCSLQPLSCGPGAPTMRKQQDPKEPQKKPTKAEIYAAAMAKHETKYPEIQPGATTPSPRARLGHPNATAYHIPSMLAPPAPTPSIARPFVPKKKIDGESPFPVYWVEVLDVAQQKWHPVDPLVTFTQWNPKALEPPASDRANSLTYVVAFESDGTAVDVTRRYAKAYNSKTRRLRVDGINPSNTARGERWWRRALRRYSRIEPTDLDQIEANELGGLEAREPMPRNVADFKDHPIYALERHLRRNEVLVPDAQSTGTVSAGSKAPLERIYRRRDVRIARTKEKWYRLGRVVLPDSSPVKVLPPRKNTSKSSSSSRFLEDDEENEEGEDDLFGDNTGIPLYTESQTELYVPPPVVDGIVPKNRFENLDVYVPSMVPAGGVHVRHSRAAQAAFILGVDYAPAVMGFEFKGRHGTAVINGVVVAEDFGEAVVAVCAGTEGMEAQEEEERRRREVLRMWSRFLKVLRIRERVMEGVDEDADEEEEGGEWLKKGKDAEMEDAGEEEGEGEGGGGFVGLNDLSDDEGALPYLTTPAHSPNLACSNLQAIRAPPSPSDDPLPIIPKTYKPGPCSSVRITLITDPLPYKQCGLFALTNLRPGQFILPYIGELHSSSPHASYDYSKSDYDLWLDREGDAAVDASRMGNEARFVNDFRGVPPPVQDKGRGKSKVNAEFRVAWDERRQERVMGVFVVGEGKGGKSGKGGIKKGEEILVSYGRGFWGERRSEWEGEGQEEEEEVVGGK
ncbi:hypothetical protein QBC44DRAFT_348834 [Cladorrhinum sp. PSN332]|nr:hypothetical protein QBC44DRAFT_348834 [Cladorrhinum sp. PSN332]